MEVYMFYLSSLSIAEKSVLLEFEVWNFSSLDRRTDDALRNIQSNVSKPWWFDDQCHTSVFQDFEIQQHFKNTLETLAVFYTVRSHGTCWDWRLEPVAIRNFLALQADAASVNNISVLHQSGGNFLRLSTNFPGWLLTTGLCRVIFRWGWGGGTTLFDDL